MSVEKRRAARQDMRLQGLIVGDDGSIISPCLMVNVSPTGANLVPKVPTDVPDSFVLLLSTNRGVQRHCEVVWRSEKNIGVRFLTPHTAERTATSFVHDTLARFSAKT